MLDSFTNILNGPIFRISFALLLIGALIAAFLAPVRKLIRKKRFKFFLYLICLLIFFALTGLLSSPKILNDVPLNSFIGAQILFFIAGIIHVIVTRIHFKELSEKKSNLHLELMFSIIIVGLALIGFVVVVGRYRTELAMSFISSGIVFLIPILVLKMYEFVTLIPVAVYKKWFYPITEELKEPEGKELNDPLVISIEFRKKTKDKLISRFKVKAPEGMEFGKLFYFFVDDYNDLHPESIISVTNPKGDATGWIFYFKRYWWSPIRHIDADKTVLWNRIREENTIIASRV